MCTSMTTARSRRSSSAGRATRSPATRASPARSRPARGFPTLGLARVGLVQTRVTLGGVKPSATWPESLALALFVARTARPYIEKSVTLAPSDLNQAPGDEPVAPPKAIDASLEVLCASRFA